MNEKAELKIFPATKHEALALLYVQSRDLSDVTPEGLAQMYEEAYSKISSAHITAESKKWIPQ